MIPAVKNRHKQSTRKNRYYDMNAATRKESVMEMIEKWKTCLKYDIVGLEDVLSRTTDPFDPAAFYVSDGWGTAYGAMRLRKLSLETGEELANILARNLTRCIYVNKDFVYAILDKRILKLNREDLSIQETYAQNVPRCSDHAEFVDEDTLLLMNYYGGTLQCFNLQTQKSRRKKMDAQYVYYDIIKKDAETFLIFQERAVFRYSPKANTIKKLTDTEPCIRCAMGNSGKIYLLCRNHIGKTGEDGKETLSSSKMLVFSSLSENDYEELELGCIADCFWLSEEEDILYLAHGNEFCIYSVAEKKLIFHHVFGGGFVYNFFVKAGKVLIYDKVEYSLTCYELK